MTNEELFSIIGMEEDAINRALASFLNKGKENYWDIIRVDGTCLYTQVGHRFEFQRWGGLFTESLDSMARVERAMNAKQKENYAPLLVATVLSEVSDGAEGDSPAARVLPLLFAEARHRAYAAIIALELRNSQESRQ